MVGKPRGVSVAWRRTQESSRLVSVTLLYVPSPPVACNGMALTVLTRRQAACVGTVYGRHRWWGTHKTLEGTTAAVASMLASTAGFHMIQVRRCGWINSHAA